MAACNLTPLKQLHKTKLAKNNTLCMALSSAAANGLLPEEMVGLASAVAVVLAGSQAPGQLPVNWAVCVVEELK